VGLSRPLRREPLDLPHPRGARRLEELADQRLRVGQVRELVDQPCLVGGEQRVAEAGGDVGTVRRIAEARQGAPVACFDEGALDTHDLPERVLQRLRQA
jgi:hypothetical protein